MTDPAPPCAIQARGLTRRFGSVIALRPLDLDVPAGATLAVLGPNGAGKSTLLRLLAGLSRPSGGTLRLGDAEEDRVARRQRIGMIGHETYLYPAMTARENLMLAGRLWRVADPAARAAELLSEQDLAGAADRPVGAFSRGMAQRVAIARALVHEPEILLLDEPFTGLDPSAADRFAERLAASSDATRTTVLVSHDLARTSQLADHGLVLVRGCAREFGAETFAGHDPLAHAYRETVRELTDAVAAEVAS